MALSTSRTLITKTGISTTQVFDMGGINISGGDFNLGSAIKLGNASGIITATSFSGNISGTPTLGTGVTITASGMDITGIVTATTIKVGSAISMTDSAISATRFHGSGANLTGIDVSSIKNGSDVKIQANASGATVTGIVTTTQNVGNIGIDLHATGSGRGSQVKLHNDHATSFVGISGDTDGDLLIYNQSNTDIIFATNNNNRSRIDSNGHFVPETNNTFDLGSTAKGWRNVYFNDLNLSNMKGNTNDVDGTQGSWTIQEGKDNLYIINRLNGKKFKIKMEEVS